MIVYVVMGNDYPHSVYKTEAAAYKFVAEANAQEKTGEQTRSLGRMRIFWRAFSFSLKE